MNKQDKKWIDRNDELPDYGEEVELSFDNGKTMECTGMFAENTTCMMAGIAGGYGYFQDEFEDMVNGLVLHDVTHWRPLTNQNKNTK